MGHKHYQARAKKLQKLSRGVLVEQNQVTGEERQIGPKAADISFRPDRTPDTDLTQSEKDRAKRKQAQRRIQRYQALVASREAISHLNDAIQTTPNGVPGE